MVSEPSTGYICVFEVYTGDASGQSQGNAQELQDASKTSCIVLGLLDSVQLLDIGHHVEAWYSLEQYIGLKEDKLSSTTVDFIRSEGNLETK